MCARLVDSFSYRVGPFYPPALGADSAFSNYRAADRRCTKILSELPVLIGSPNSSAVQGRSQSQREGNTKRASEKLGANSVARRSLTPSREASVNFSLPSHPLARYMEQIYYYNCPVHKPAPRGGRANYGQPLRLATFHVWQCQEHPAHPAPRRSAAQGPAGPATPKWRIWAEMSGAQKFPASTSASTRPCPPPPPTGPPATKPCPSHERAGFNPPVPGPRRSLATGPGRPGNPKMADLSGNERSIKISDLNFRQHSSLPLSPTPGRNLPNRVPGLVRAGFGPTSAPGPTEQPAPA